MEDSPGWGLIKTKIFNNAEEKFDVHCDLQQFDLSAHTGRDGLFGIIKKLKPETVICVHGEDKNCKRFARDIESLGIQAVAPKNGEVVKI